MSADLANPTTLAARDLPAVGAAAEAAIRDLFRQLLDSWDRGDGRAYAAAFTADAYYIAFDGSHTKGREAIADAHQRLFDTWLKGTRLAGALGDIRFVSPTVALVRAGGGVLMPGRATVRPGRDSIQTLVAVKGEDGWRFTAFHNTRVQRRSLPRDLLFGIATRVLRR